MEFAQIAVAREAARGEHDGLLGADVFGGALGGLDLDADHAAGKRLLADDFRDALAVRTSTPSSLAAFVRTVP